MSSNIPLHPLIKTIFEDTYALYGEKGFDWVYQKSVESFKSQLQAWDLNAVTQIFLFAYSGHEIKDWSDELARSRLKDFQIGLHKDAATWLNDFAIKTMANFCEYLLPKQFNESEKRALIRLIACDEVSKTLGQIDSLTLLDPTHWRYATVVLNERYLKNSQLAQPYTEEEQTVLTHWQSLKMQNPQALEELSGFVAKFLLANAHKKRPIKMSWCKPPTKTTDAFEHAQNAYVALSDMGIQLNPQDVARNTFAAALPEQKTKLLLSSFHKEAPLIKVQLHDYIVQQLLNKTSPIEIHVNYSNEPRVLPSNVDLLLTNNTPTISRGAGLVHLTEKLYYYFMNDELKEAQNSRLFLIDNPILSNKEGAKKLTPPDLLRFHVLSSTKNYNFELERLIALLQRINFNEITSDSSQDAFLNIVTMSHNYIKKINRLFDKKEPTPLMREQSEQLKLYLKDLTFKSLRSLGLEHPWLKEVLKNTKPEGTTVKAFIAQMAQEYVAQKSYQPLTLAATDAQSMRVSSNSRRI